MRQKQHMGDTCASHENGMTPLAHGMTTRLSQVHQQVSNYAEQSATYLGRDPDVMQ